jgi:ferredoxin, 2Fe-2S
MLKASADAAKAFPFNNISMLKMTFIDPQGKSHEVDAPEGLSVLEVAHRNGFDLEGACEGCMACSTCHVIADPQWFDKLPVASEEEEDMLDLAFDVHETSRLGCQITMTKDLDGLVVTLPAQHYNLIGG